MMLLAEEDSALQGQMSMASSRHAWNDHALIDTVGLTLEDVDSSEPMSEGGVAALGARADDDVDLSIRFWKAMDISTVLESAGLKPASDMPFELMKHEHEELRHELEVDVTQEAPDVPYGDEQTPPESDSEDVAYKKRRTSPDTEAPTGDDVDMATASAVVVKREIRSPERSESPPKKTRMADTGRGASPYLEESEGAPQPVSQEQQDNPAGLMFLTNDDSDPEDLDHLVLPDSFVDSSELMTAEVDVPRQ